MNFDDTRFRAMVGLTECGMKRSLRSENFKLNSSICPAKKKIRCHAKCGPSPEDDKHQELLTEDLTIDDTDVEYKIFLDHLREDGTSYVLEIKNSKDGKMFSLKYEGEEGQCPSLNNQKSCCMDSLSDVTDVEYKMFLDHVRKDGESYVLEIGKDGEMISLKYEGEDGSPQTSSETPTRNGVFNGGKGTCPGKNNWKSGSLGRTPLRRSGSVSKETSKKSVPLSLSDSRCNVGCSFVEADYHTFIKHVKVHGDSYVLNLKSKDGKIITVSYEEETVSNTRKKKPVVLKKQVLQTATKSVERTQHKTSKKRKISFTNDLHQTNSHFGSSNQRSSGLIVKEEKAEEDVLLYEMQTQSERLPMERISNKALVDSSFDSMLINDDGDVNESPICSNSSNFEKKLMAECRRPYDHVEHRNLWTEVNRQTPIKRLRVLRGWSKSYETEDMGLSYLEHYPDFEEKIRLVSGDRHEALYLLRGFFFWLKNTCHPDAFMPWSRSPNGSDSDCEIVED